MSKKNKNDERKRRKKEKNIIWYILKIIILHLNFTKVFGVLIGFSGIVFLFSDKFLINENNFISAIFILVGSTFYVIGGLLTLKVSNKKNHAGLKNPMNNLSYI